MKLAIIPGDGVGPEIMNAAIKVIKAVAVRYEHKIELIEVLACDEGIQKAGTPLPKDSLDVCLNADAVLLGNTGLEKYRNCHMKNRPEYALIKLRKELGVTTNIRPVKLYPQLESLSPLKSTALQTGLDYLFVRDISGGVLCSKQVKGNGENGPEAYEYEYYNQKIVEDTAHFAFQLAEKRRKKVTSLDKSNVLESSGLWRRTVSMIGNEYPQVQLTHGYIDAAAMKLILSPGDYDVILTSNMFGDIISDEGTGLTGTPGLFGSAELSANGKALYTPNQLHYPDEQIAGKQKVCPIGMICAAALMFRCSFGLENEANAIEKAVETVLEQGYITADMSYRNAKIITTEEMGNLIINAL